MLFFSGKRIGNPFAFRPLLQHCFWASGPWPKGSLFSPGCSVYQASFCGKWQKASKQTELKFNKGNLSAHKTEKRQGWSWLQVRLDLRLLNKQDHFSVSAPLPAVLAPFSSFSWWPPQALISPLLVWDWRPQCYNSSTSPLAPGFYFYFWFWDSFWLDQLRSHGYSWTNHRAQRDMMHWLVGTWEQVTPPRCPQGGKGR